MHTPSDTTHVPYAVRAKYILEELTGYGNLHVHYVLDSEGGDEIGEKGNGTKMIVAVSFTAETRLFFRRPSQKQYDLLIQIFGEQPLWYKDALPKHFFGAYCIS